MRLASALLIAFAGFHVSFGQNHPDISGTWSMDIARSESAHHEVPIESSTIEIRVRGNELHMEVSRRDQGAPPFHEILQLKLDGSESEYTGDSGVTVTGKAHWSGASLIVETIRNIQGSTVTTHYVHSLSRNGREMTIDKTLAVQHGYQGTNPAMAQSTGHGKDIYVRVRQ